MSTRLCLLLWLIWVLCFCFDALTELGAFMRTDFFLCISVLRVASRPRVKLASCKSALNPQWFTLLTVLRRWSRRWSYSLLLCGLFYEAVCFKYVLPGVILFLCFSVLLALRLPCLGKRGSWPHNLQNSMLHQVIAYRCMIPRPAFTELRTAC